MIPLYPRKDCLEIPFCQFNLKVMCSFLFSRSWSSLFGIKKGGNSNNFSFSVPWMLQLFVAAMQYKQSQEALSFFRIIPFVQFPPSVILKFLPPWWSTRRELFLLGGVILNWLCSAAFGSTLYAVVVVYAFGNEMVTIYCCVYRLNHVLNNRSLF